MNITTHVIYTRQVDDAAPGNQKHARPPNSITVTTFQSDLCTLAVPKCRSIPQGAQRKQNRNMPHKKKTRFNTGQQHLIRIYNALHYRASEVILTATATAVLKDVSPHKFTSNEEKQRIRQYHQLFCTFFELQLILRGKLFDSGFLYPNWKNVTAQCQTILKLEVIDELREILVMVEKVLEQPVHRILW